MYAPSSAVGCQALPHWLRSGHQAHELKRTRSTRRSQTTFKVQRREADVGPDVGTSPTIIGVVSVRRLSAVRRGIAGQIV
jgi:hypothetical protein